MITTLISIILLLFIINNYLYNNRNAQLLNKIPGPKLHFLIGNTWQVLKSQVSLFYIPRKCASIYDGICRFIILSANIVFLYNPEDIEIVLTSQKQITKGGFYQFLHPWLDTGLLTSTGKKWQNRRKILTPAFHFNILREFCKVFVEHSGHLVEKLKKTDGVEVEVLPFITDFTLNAVCETAMGYNLNTSQKETVEYKNAIYRIGEFLVHRIFRAWLHPQFIFDRTSTGIEQKVALKTLHSFTKKVIDDRRKNRAISGDKFVVEDYVEEQASSQKKRLAMLDLLLSAESEGKIDADGIREEVDTFMFEGHDTTTVAMTYILMLLANNPKCQELVYEEIQSIFGDNMDDIRMEKLNDLKYMERCIKEALRLYPSVPFFSRKLTEDTQLKNYIVPAGTECEVHVFDLHRNAKLYPNPEKFDPDRFLPENCAKRHNFAYIPFSAGPRNCIGQKFAILEIKTMLLTVLKCFKLEAVTKPDDIIFYVDLVLRSKTPIKVKFVPRV